MHEVNHKPPERMTPDERRTEIASILARGLARLRMTQAPVSKYIPTVSDISLAFSGTQSVHSDPVNNRPTESQ